MPNWIPLTKPEEIEDLSLRSHQKPCLIYKHSSRCNISTIAQYRLEAEWSLLEQAAVLYWVDVISNRQVSNAVASNFEVYHESPQVLLIHEGACIFDVSHLDISVATLKESLAMLRF